VALSWLNLPCALKAAIGIGKRTLGHPRQSAAPQGPHQGPQPYRERRGWQIASLSLPAGSIFGAAVVAVVVRLLASCWAQLTHECR
jgi:hypothetical protein